MFLLIRQRRDNGIVSFTFFTFQYVSINTRSTLWLVIILLALHSNMFLLIPYSRSCCRVRNLNFTFQYVSINTGKQPAMEIKATDFTFQYVSINTKEFIYGLLSSSPLYIPICFY